MLLISDANVFIDFETAGLTNQLFALDAIVATPDILYYSELAEQHAHLLECGLKLLEVRAEYVAQIPMWREKYGVRPSGNDYLALALAKQERSPLITGDQALKRAAEAELVEVHGTVYLLRKLFETGTVTKAEIQEAAAKMKEKKRRLPWNRIEEMF